MLGKTNSGMTFIGAFGVSRTPVVNLGFFFNTYPARQSDMVRISGRRLAKFCSKLVM